MKYHKYLDSYIKEELNNYYKITKNGMKIK